VYRPVGLNDGYTKTTNYSSPKTGPLKRTKVYLPRRLSFVPVARPILWWNPYGYGIDLDLVFVSVRQHFIITRRLCWVTHSCFQSLTSTVLVTNAGKLKLIIIPILLSCLICDCEPSAGWVFTLHALEWLIICYCLLHTVLNSNVLFKRQKSGGTSESLCVSCMFPVFFIDSIENSFSRNK